MKPFSDYEIPLSYRPRRSAYVVRLIFVFALALFAFGFFARADEREDNSMKGAESIYVEVTINSDSTTAGSALIRNGLTEDNIRADVELVLQNAKIKTATKSAFKTVANIPKLYITVSLITEPESGALVYTQNLQLYQWVYVARDSALSCWAATWSNPHYGRQSQNTLRQLRDFIIDDARSFASTYIRINGLTPPGDYPFLAQPAPVAPPYSPPQPRLPRPIPSIPPAPPSDPGSANPYSSPASGGNRGGGDREANYLWQGTAFITGFIDHKRHQDFGTGYIRASSHSEAMVLAKEAMTAQAASDGELEQGSVVITSLTGGP